MIWRILRGAVGRYREMILGAAVIGVASYELLEIWVLQLPRAAGQ